MKRARVRQTPSDCETNGCGENHRKGKLCAKARKNSKRNKTGKADTGEGNFNDVPINVVEENSVKVDYVVRGVEILRGMGEDVGKEIGEQVENLIGGEIRKEEKGDGVGGAYREGWPEGVGVKDEDCKWPELGCWGEWIIEDELMWRDWICNNPQEYWENMNNNDWAGTSNITRDGEQQFEQWDDNLWDSSSSNIANEGSDSSNENGSKEDQKP